MWLTRFEAWTPLTKGAANIGFEVISFRNSNVRERDKEQLTSSDLPVRVERDSRIVLDNVEPSNGSSYLETVVTRESDLIHSKSFVSE